MHVHNKNDRKKSSKNLKHKKNKNVQIKKKKKHNNQTNKQSLVHGMSLVESLFYHTCTVSRRTSS